VSVSKSKILPRTAKSYLAQQDKSKLMFYVYVLKSKTNKDLYVGSTEDLRNRYRLHNSGRVKSTRSATPWVLVYYEAYRSKEDATKREKKLKMHAVKKELVGRLENSLGN